MKFLFIFVSGLFFGFGLAMSGMLNPSKVRAFLDLSGQWDPSLAFVMMGGIFVTAFGFWLVHKKENPLFSDNFNLPISRSIDMKLIGGSAMFGVGWGIGGLCPGPSIAILSSNFFPAITFTVSMIIGITVASLLLKPDKVNVNEKS